MTSASLRHGTMPIQLQLRESTGLVEFYFSGRQERSTKSHELDGQNRVRFVCFLDRITVAAGNLQTRRYSRESQTQP
jgi:hypothetical protein